MEKRNIVKNQKGFTLIEIIAVLVILGILAAVAVPKFIDLQKSAQEKALAGALAEGVSTVSMAYGQQLLDNKGVATVEQIITLAEGNRPASKDFSFSFTADGSDSITVGVTGKADGNFVGVDGTNTTWSKQ